MAAEVLMMSTKGGHYWSGAAWEDTPEKAKPMSVTPVAVAPSAPAAAAHVVLPPSLPTTSTAELFIRPLEHMYQQLDDCDGAGDDELVCELERLRGTMLLHEGQPAPSHPAPSHTVRGDHAMATAPVFNWWIYVFQVTTHVFYPFTMLAFVPVRVQ